MDKEDKKRMIGLLATIEYSEFNEIILFSIINRTKSNFEAIGMAECLKNNLIMMFLDKKEFMRGLKQQIEKESFSDHHCKKER